MKKKILIFIDWYLPGYKAGGPIQSISNLVNHLKDDFEFSVVTRDTDYCETEPYKNVKSNEWNILENGIRVYYFSSDQLTRSNIRNLIRKENFDSVYLNGIYSLYFTLYPLFFLRKKCAKQIVIAARGMLAESALGVKKTKKQFFIRAVKVLGLFDEVVFHATNENEKQEIHKALGEKTKIKIAENLPPKGSITRLPERTKTTGSLKLVNIARIAPEKNLLFALQILKNVKKPVKFDFYGPVYNTDYWKECEHALSELPSNVKASYKGSIEAEKVLDVFKDYHFMFMPTRGENFGHIILQSLLTGCPIIISDQTPWKQLQEKQIGWDLPLLQTELFVNIIEQCVQMDRDEYLQLSQNAFKIAEQYASNSEILKKNRHLFL